MKKSKIVIIGGGTGTMAILQGLRKYEDLDLSVIVSMTDDGGSNAAIRDEFGLLPLSDLRKSIIALSETDRGILRKLFVYRFSKGNGLSGHTLGNLIMMALSQITGSELKAIEATKKLFRVKGKVIPVTLKHSHLVAEYQSGLKIKGEHLIDEPILPHEAGKIKKLFLNPVVKANKEAVQVLEKADYIIAGPGDLFTTTLASMVVPGISKAIKRSRAKFIFISNLMTKVGQTTDMKVTDLVLEIKKYAGKYPDIVLANKGKFSSNILRKYSQQGEKPILDDCDEQGLYKVVRADLVSRKEIIKDKGDTLKRSLIRHDSNKLGNVVYKLIKNYYE